MQNLSKRLKKCLETIDGNKNYSLEEAISILKNMLHPKFDETVELSCNLNIDPQKSEQLVRGTTVLPHGIGKSVRVCVFCKGEDINKAKAAGADFVGSTELIEKIKQGWLDFDQAASTLEMMNEVAQLGKFLGPRGMMPSPKVGTVGPDISRIVKDLKSGKVQFKTDKTGNIHTIVGKISFSIEHLSENTKTMLRAILSARPAAVKGRFLRTVSICTTMSPGIKLDTSNLGA